MSHPKISGWSLGFLTVRYLGLPLRFFFCGWQGASEAHIHNGSGTSEQRRHPPKDQVSL